MNPHVCGVGNKSHKRATYCVFNRFQWSPISYARPPKNYSSVCVCVCVQFFNTSMEIFHSLDGTDRVVKACIALAKSLKRYTHTHTQKCIIVTKTELKTFNLVTVKKK